jgi:hypothetical protein
LLLHEGTLRSGNNVEESDNHGVWNHMFQYLKG